MPKIAKVINLHLCKLITYIIYIHKWKYNDYLPYTIKGVYCPCHLAIDVLSGKWKILIIFKLSRGTLRFNELKKLLPKTSDKVLSQQLKELEEYNIVHREVYQVIPPKVEYSLTEKGEKLRPVLKALQNWGMNFKIE